MSLAHHHLDRHYLREVAHMAIRSYPPELFIQVQSTAVFTPECFPISTDSSCRFSRFTKWNKETRKPGTQEEMRKTFYNYRKTASYFVFLQPCLKDEILKNILSTMGSQESYKAEKSLQNEVLDLPGLESNLLLEILLFSVHCVPSSPLTFTREHPC